MEAEINAAQLLTIIGRKEVEIITIREQFTLLAQEHNILKEKLKAFETSDKEK